MDYVRGQMAPWETSKPAPKGIATRIRQGRERLGLSQIALAKRTGISSATINQLESGHHDNPSWEVIRAIERELGRSITVDDPVETVVSEAAAGIAASDPAATPEKAEATKAALYGAVSATLDAAAMTELGDVRLLHFLADNSRKLTEFVRSLGGKATMEDIRRFYLSSLDEKSAPKPKAKRGKRRAPKKR